jgi:hypothetical protein
MRYLPIIFLFSGCAYLPHIQDPRLGGEHAYKKMERERDERKNKPTMNYIDGKWVEDPNFWSRKEVDQPEVVLIIDHRKHGHTENQK